MGVIPYLIRHDGLHSKMHYQTLFWTAFKILKEKSEVNKRVV